MFKKKANSTVNTVVSIAALALAAVLVAILMLGKLDVTCSDDSITMRAPLWKTTELRYSDIDSAEYRQNVDVGSRTLGVGTSRFSVGTYKNSEFGTYTLYAYTAARDFIVLTSAGKTYVIGTDSAEIKAIFATLTEKTGQ